MKSKLLKPGTTHLKSTYCESKRAHFIQYPNLLAYAGSYGSVYTWRGKLCKVSIYFPKRFAVMVVEV